MWRNMSPTELLPLAASFPFRSVYVVFASRFSRNIYIGYLHRKI